MSDIINGKLIYQLTSASALKDTDLFVISSADNLTRSITMSQLKLAIISDLYAKEDINDMIDDLKLQIKGVADRMTDYENNISEFRNEFNNQLNEIRNNFTTEINNVRSEFNVRVDELEADMNKQITSTIKSISDLSTSVDNRFKTVNTNITNLNNSLTDKINEVDERLTNTINGLISYGTTIPTTLATGKVYLQYF